MVLTAADVEPLLTDRPNKRRGAAAAVPPPPSAPHWSVELLHGFAAEFRALGSGFTRHVWRIIFYGALALALAYACSTWFTDARAAYNRDAFQKEKAQATFDKLDCGNRVGVARLGEIGENSCVEAQTVIGRWVLLHAATTATQQLAVRANPCTGQCTMLFYMVALVAACLGGAACALVGVYFVVKWLHAYAQRQRQVLPTLAFPPDVAAAAKKAL